MKKNFKILFALISVFSINLACCVPYDFYAPQPIISRYNLLETIQNVASDYIQPTGYYPLSIPSKLKPEYDLKIEESYDQLIREINMEWNNTISFYHVKEVVHQKLEQFKKNLSKIVLSYDLENQIDLLTSKLANINNIPLMEYIQKKDEILRILRNTMQQDFRNYVRRNEITKEIKEKFKYYLKESSNFWGTFFAGSTSPTYPSTYTQPSTYTPPVIKIYQNNLSSKVSETATLLLTSIGINSNNIPARVVSDYSDKIQKINSRLSSMFSFYKDYVTPEEVEKITKEELQSIVDKINYRDDVCSICLDKFNVGQKIGILNCNGEHFFHKECIYSWLNSDFNKSCPLCRAEGRIVATIIDVPTPKYL